MYIYTCILYSVIHLLVSALAEDKKYPHIITILADDLGWNDVGFHGSSQIRTPNIDALGYYGIILNRHYVQSLCTPSRAALLTGKYPIHTGMQHSVILEPEPRGLPLEEKILPEYLKEIGYNTHAVGKWHLGYFRKEYTPTFRGFDSHYGYWNGFQDYYNQSVISMYETPMKGLDMRHNLEADYESVGNYSTHLYTNEAVKIIKGHNVSKPMFMYLAHLAPHAGNDGNDYQAPDDEVAKYAHIPDARRRVYAAMVSVLDDSVGKVITALRQKGMLENSIILFMADNGAPTHGIHSNRGSNYPLRGQKDSPWEGGSRGVAAIWSPLLNNMKRVSNQLIHISDWLPTLWGALGRDVNELGKIDGINLWNALKENTPSPRTIAVVNIDPIVPYEAIHFKEWKYIKGDTSKGKYNGWFGESRDTGPYDMTNVIASDTAVAILGYITEKQIEREYYNKRVNSTFNAMPLTVDEVIKLRSEATIACKARNDNDQPCDPLKSPCIFNINDDPCEMRNLATLKPDLLKAMQNLVEKYRATSVEPGNKKLDDCANPIHYNNVWVSWMDFEKPVSNNIFDKLSPSAVITFKIFFAVCGLVVLFAIFILVKRSKCFKRKLVMHNSLKNKRVSISSIDGHKRYHARDMSVSSISVAQRIEMFEDHAIK